LDAAIVDRIATDVGIISLAPLDSGVKIYSFFPATDIEYTPDEPASIIYDSKFTGRPLKWSYPKQYSDFLLFIRVQSIDQLILNQIVETINVLFDKTSITTDNWSIKWIEINAILTIPNEGSESNTIWGKDISFKFTNVFER